MGQLFTIVCENQKCLYHAKLRQGPGMLSFARAIYFRDAVVNLPFTFWTDEFQLWQFHQTLMRTGKYDKAN